MLTIFLGKKQGRNEFVIRLQPFEAIYMKLTVCQSFGLSILQTMFDLISKGELTSLLFCMQVKQPGLEMSAVQSELDLSYGQRYQGITIPEAYERLILDTYILFPYSHLLSLLNSSLQDL